MDKPVKIVPFDDIKVDQHQILGPLTARSFSNQPTYAASSYDANTQPCEIALFCFTPCRRSAQQFFAKSRGRGQLGMKSAGKPTTDSAHTATPLSFVLTAAAPEPESAAPSFVRPKRHPKKWVACRRKYSRGKAFFRNNIIGAHALPAGGRMAMQEDKASTCLDSPRQRALKVVTLKAHVAMQLPLALFWNDDFIHEGGDAGPPLAGTP